MKILVCICFALTLTMSAFAQKYVPQIKEGSVLSYEAFSRALGQGLPLTLTVKSLGDPMQLQWYLAALGSGTFAVTGKAVESGTKIGFKQPEPDEVTKLKDDETLCFLSKSTFKDLVTNKAFTLNGQNFTAATDTSSFKINDKDADTFYAVSANGKTKIWVLNNPAFPMICKILGGPHGLDLTLTAVKE